MDSELFQLLCCPESRQMLSSAEKTLCEQLNAEIRAGKIRGRGGQPVSEPIEGGLIRADRKFLYPIRHGIPIMLIDESIPITGDPP